MLVVIFSLMGGLRFDYIIGYLVGLGASQYPQFAQILEPRKGLVGWIDLRLRPLDGKLGKLVPSEGVDDPVSSTNNRTTNSSGGSYLGSFSNPFRTGGVTIGGSADQGVFSNYDDHLEKNKRTTKPKTTVEQKTETEQEKDEELPQADAVEE